MSSLAARDGVTSTRKRLRGWAETGRRGAPQNRIATPQYFRQKIEMSTTRRHVQISVSYFEIWGYASLLGKVEHLSVLGLIPAFRTASED
jgi:hypothetical protein